MANSYAGDTFQIDTSTDLDGLTTLKGGAPDVDDDLYVFSGATVTLTSTTTLKAVYIGRNTGGVTSAGIVNVLTGADLELCDGASGGIFIDASGDLVLAGATGSKARIVPASGKTEFLLQNLDGTLQVSDGEIDAVEIICAIAGSLELTRATMTIQMSATTELIVSGTLVLASSEINCTNRWACYNYGYVTLDAFSVMNNAYYTLTYSGGGLIFIDDPDFYALNYGLQTVRNAPLGGTKGRGKQLGSMGRTISIGGTFSTTNLTYWQKLQSYFRLTAEAFKLTWSEGSINNGLLTNGSVKRVAEDVQELPYNLELQEIY